MNYKITRIGLLNFWYFDDEEFNFYDGKLLLRGGNGSGKSVTMQSFIPLILDGNKTPSRLDPFGTKEKKIEDYLLGPSDGEQKEDAIGYLYMETYDKQKDKYITIGIGLHARRGRPTDFWGFALKDGKRIRYDFQLYKSYSNKVLMTKKELRANIGSNNLFVENQKEYKNMVNDLLFGFRDIDSYDEFISVLLQLRSPKLSKEYNPTKLMQILSSVLQPLTEEDVRPLSEAIEDTNKTKEKVDTLNNNIKAIANLSKVYQNYNEINLYNKALNVSENESSLRNLKKQITSEENNILNINKRLEEINENISKLENELIEINTKISSIDDNDLKKHTETLQEINENIISTKNTIEIIKSKFESRINREKEIQINIKNIDNKIFNKEQEINDTKEVIIELSEEIKLDDFVLNIKNNEINFTYLNERLTKYKNKLNQIKIKLEEKENLEETLSQLETENIKLQKEIELKEQEKKNLDKLFSEEIDNFKDELNLLDKQDKLITLEEEPKNKIFDLIDNYNSTNYLQAIEIFQKVVNYYKTNLITEKSKIEYNISTEKQNLNKLNEELKQLKENEELEYIEEPETLEAEKILKENSIPYIQLYKVIEFKDNISDQDKNRLEDLLISMNILNAKIVPKNYLDKIKNIKSIFLKEGTPKENNILKYFNIIDNEIIDKIYLKNILSSISISPNETIHITPDNYTLDFLIGYPSKNYQSKFIGLLKRQEEQKKNIQNKEQEIELKNKLILNYENIRNEINNKLNNLDITLQKFPSNNKLEEISLKISKLTILIDSIFERSKILTNNANKINNDIRNKLEEINKIKENITIPLNLLSYKNCIMITEELSKKLINLQNHLQTKETYDEQKISLNISLDNIKEEIEYQNEELNLKNKLLNELESKKNAIEVILSNPDYQKLLEQLKLLTIRKNEIPKENNSLREEKGKLENAIENIKNSLDKEKHELKTTELKFELTKEILEKEYHLKYVFTEEEINVDEILQTLKNRENSDLTKAFENYIVAFNNYKQELLDYRLNTKEIFTNNEDLFTKYKDLGLEEKIINQILSTMNRQDLETTYQGKKLNIYDLSNCLKNAKEESENYINLQERHLFEDILLKTVGNKIRDHIESSKEWVKKINDIMHTTQIDSNLSFELEWKSKTAYTEDELDTKELVRLFKIDAGQLDKKDSERLRTHFQSQIKQEQAYSDKTNDSYTNIIFKVLDYRNWFEFKLYYKRKTGERKELTNKVYSVLSGGERAKSMYVPLFASVYAKLLSAKDNALRVIALDEAFAGVDIINIREMFDILSQLNLDYILTSQSLWGDYDTIKELSICELIKDEIHKAVAVRHYRWNGHSKEIMGLSDIYEQ